MLFVCKCMHLHWDISIGPTSACKYDNAIYTGIYYDIYRMCHIYFCVWNEFHWIIKFRRNFTSVEKISWEFFWHQKFLYLSLSTFIQTWFSVMIFTDRFGGILQFLDWKDVLFSFSFSNYNDCLSQGVRTYLNSTWF